MLQVKKERVEELYELYEERQGYMTEHMEYAWQNEERSLSAYEKSVTMDKKIEAKESEIAKETSIVVSVLMKRLMDAIFPRSLSRYIKCLEVCGVEVKK